MTNRNKEIKDSRSVARLVSSVVIGIILIGMLIGGIVLFMYLSASQKPLDPSNKKTTEIVVQPGETATMIADNLEKKKIIKNSSMFKYYLKFNNVSNFQAGNYELSPSMTFKQIAKSLQEGKVYVPVAFKMNIPEGITLEQISQIVEKNAGIKAEDFMKEVDSSAFIKKMQKKFPKLVTKAVMNKEIKHPLEGYLYPATYEFSVKDPSTEEVVSKMLTAMQDNAFPLWDKYGGMLISEAGEEKHLSFHEFLTFSSLVEREATGLTDRAKIASVFINRMAENPEMPLQTDPTVLYALGGHKEKTYEADTKVDSPYNTYQNVGLPPGPIATSGQESMESSLNPAKTEYLYFLADKDGKNYFSKTLEEHNKLKSEHIGHE